MLVVDAEPSSSGKLWRVALKMLSGRQSAGPPPAARRVAVQLSRENPSRVQPRGPLIAQCCVRTIEERAAGH